MMSRLHHCNCKIPNFCVPLPPSSISSMEVSFVHFCRSTFGVITTLPPSHPSPLRSSTKFFSAPRCYFNPKFPSRSARPPKKPADPVPARDRIIKFGKHKGKMLGTLPSSYLQWMVKNSVEVPHLAKEVLEDPVYRDRIEWEYVQRILHYDDFVGGGGRRKEYESEDVIADIKEIAEKFDWDMGDRKGWSKVKLDRLGTSFSGPIPRKQEEEKAWLSTKLKDSAGKEEEEEEAAIVRDRRTERRQKRILKSDWELGVGLGLGLGLDGREEKKLDGELGATEEEEEESRSDGENNGQVVQLGKSQEPTVQKGTRFPGRGSLFEKAKVLKNRKRSS